MHGTLTAHRLWQRAAGAAALVAAILLYGTHGGSWGLFLLLLLAPDLGALGYLVSARAGALGYNATHVYAGPLVLALAGAATGQTWAVLGALIWTAHIGMDRMLGYGLKDVRAVVASPVM